MTPDLGLVFHKLLTPTSDPGPKKLKMLSVMSLALRICGHLCHMHIDQAKCCRVVIPITAVYRSQNRHTLLGQSFDDCVRMVISIRGDHGAGVTDWTTARVSIFLVRTGDGDGILNENRQRCTGAALSVWTPAAVLTNFENRTGAGFGPEWRRSHFLNMRLVFSFHYYYCRLFFLQSML